MTNSGLPIERKWFRTLLLVAGGVLLLAIAFGAAVAIRWRMSAKEAPVLLDAPAYDCTSDGPELGKQFKAVLKYRLPWAGSIRRIDVDPGENLQLTSEPEFRRTRIRWGYSEWTVAIPLQAYRPGDCGGGSVTADFFAGESIETPLPELKVADLPLPMDDDGTSLSLAPHIREETAVRSFKLRLIVAVAAVAVLVSLAVCILLLRRKRKAAEYVKPAWETALEAIGDIRTRVRSGKVSPESAVAGLTDVVRHYMEERFHLRAERQTTAEFLADLERNDRLLEAKDRSFLRSFLNFADMVKFARMQTGPDLFEQTAEKAEELVFGTVPHEGADPQTNPGGPE